MAATNNITGDEIKTKANSSAYQANYDLIDWSKGVSEKITLSEKDFEFIAELIDNPPEPTTFLKELFQKYNKKEEDNVEKFPPFLAEGIPLNILGEGE